MPSDMQIRKKKYLNNIAEQDYRFIKKRVRSMLGLKSFRIATYITSEIEAMHMMKRTNSPGEKSVSNQVNPIHQLFGLPA
jgi:IS6 family transposase